MSELNEKECIDCKEIKSLFYFGKHKGSKDGYKSSCKNCFSLYMQNYRRKPEVKQRTKDLDLLNKENRLLAGREYYNRNKEKVNFKNKKWRKENPTKLKEYYQKNKGDLLKYNKTLRGKFSKWKTGARVRGIEWNLEFDQIKDWPLICYYTNLQLVSEPNNFNTISLDRIDSDLGYNVDNVVYCCTHINLAKRSLGVNDFIKICKLVAENSK